MSKKNENLVAIRGQHEYPDVLSYFESSINLADNWLNFILENDPGYFVSWKASLTDILRVNVVLIWSRLFIPMSICITPATFRIFWKNLYMPFQDPLCPFVLGCDHSISYPVVGAVSKKLGRPAGIFHLDDAHPDICSAFEVSSLHLKIRIFEHEAEWLMNSIQMNTDSPMLCR